MELVDVKGKNAEVEVDLAAGKLRVAGSLHDDDEMVKGSLVLETDLVKVLKKVAVIIPGSIDDAVIGIVVAAIEAAKAADPVPAA